MQSIYLPMGLVRSLYGAGQDTAVVAVGESVEALEKAVVLFNEEGF